MIHTYFGTLFLAGLLLGLGPEVYASVKVDNDAAFQLVQSVPLETQLEQPDLPMTVDVWLEMIKGAKSTLDLAQFYLSSQVEPGSGKKAKRPMEPVLVEIEKAAKRGVKIRILVSQSMLEEDPETLKRLRKLKGTEIRVYDLSLLTGGVHHAKYWIVDGKDIFVGSQNFDWRSLTQIHELGIRVRDSDVSKQLARIFEVDWRVAKTHQLPFLDDLISPNPLGLVKPVELVSSPSLLTPRQIRSSLQALIDLINSAKKSLRVQLLDYSPVYGAQVYWPELDTALRAAASRGVKIQMMVSNGNTVARAVDYLKSLGMISGVEIKVVTLPSYSGGAIPYARVIHSKYMVVDDELFWIGTSNWSKGYFYNSRNVEMIFRKPELASAGNRVFQKLWASGYSEKVELAKWDGLGR